MGSLGRVKQVRRDIARIKTVQGEQKRGVTFAAKAAPVAKKAPAIAKKAAPAKEAAVKEKPTKAPKAKAVKEETK